MSLAVHACGGWIRHTRFGKSLPRRRRVSGRAAAHAVLGLLLSALSSSDAFAQDSLGTPGEPGIRHLALETDDGWLRGASLSLYGFLRLDAGRKMMFSDGTPHSTSTSWRSSRIGADAITPQPWEGLTLKGKIEYDFLSGTDARPRPRLRHAYLSGETENGWSLLAGQTYDAWFVRDVTMLAYLYPCNRRPQLRLTKTADFSDGTRVTARLAAVQNRGDNLDPSHAGSNKNVQHTLLQSAIIAERHLIAEAPAKISLSGSYGRERNEFRENPAADGLYDTDLLMVTAFLPLCSCLAVSGAGYAGENIDTYFLGGIASGVNPVQGAPVRSVGGWFQSTVRVTPKWRFNAGHVTLDSHNGEENSECCSRYACQFVNSCYRVTPRINVVTEGDYFSKLRVGEDTTTNVRLQVSLYLYF